MQYLLSDVLAAFVLVLLARLHRGLGAVLLLTGPPGGGKTSFAQHLAKQLKGKVYTYSGTPDKERNLLYDIDVGGVVRRENAWIQGPAWEAFLATSRGEYAVLLLDEVDKTSAGFDAFLLRLLEEFTFPSPEGVEVKADPAKLIVILTSNGRREFRPELLRRCQRVHVPWPTDERLKEIIRSIAPTALPGALLDLVVRVGDAVRQKSPDAAPSPKEMAYCCMDMLTLGEAGEQDQNIWRTVAASWLTKDGGGAMHVDKCCTYKWGNALKSEGTAALKVVAA